MCKTKLRWFSGGLYLALVGVLLFSLAATAQAGTLIGVSQDPTPPMGPFTGDDANEDMIMVGSPTAPIPITPDPTTTDPWMKQFIINRDGQGWSPGDTVSVMEFITLGPPTSTHPVPIVDWHEDIDPSVGAGSNFKWAGGSIEAAGASFPGETGSDGHSIWFNFPPLLPGDVFKITKQLVWDGDEITDSGPGNNDYLIKIDERPSVPEPNSLLLCGLALLVTAGSRRQQM